VRPHRRPANRLDRQEGVAQPGAARLRGPGLTGATDAGGGALDGALARRAEALGAIASPIGHEKALCDALEPGLRARFPRVDRVKNSLVVRVDGPADPARPLLALCGHLDTVPVHDEDRGPPRREGGRLVAPGASDMKGGLAVLLELAERLPRAERFCDLLLVLYAREEGPYLENELGDLLAAPGLLDGVSFALCLEPTDNVLQLGCVGSIHATVTFTGRAAHSARPWQGENAVHRAGALLAELHARAPREARSGGLVFREVLSATRIEGGRARNVVPDRCTLNLNYRFAPDRTVEDAAAELVALGERHGAEVALSDLSPACPAYVDHPVVKRLVERTELAVEPKQAWTDVARLAQHGIPAANLGPGATAQAHQRGEWIELDALARGYRLLETFLRAP
jgi:succinyl-diaminopimelate desuccinylase